MPNEETNQNIDKDMKERLDGFINEIRPLMGKYELGIGAVAELTPDGRINAKPIFMSTRKPLQPSTVNEGAEVKLVENKAGLSE